MYRIVDKNANDIVQNATIFYKKFFIYWKKMETENSFSLWEKNKKIFKYEWKEGGWEEMGWSPLEMRSRIMARLYQNTEKWNVNKFQEMWIKLFTDLFPMCELFWE